MENPTNKFLKSSIQDIVIHSLVKQLHTLNISDKTQQIMCSITQTIYKLCAKGMLSNHKRQAYRSISAFCFVTDHSDLSVH